MSAALVLEGKLEGCKDSFEFAEWLVAEKQHYGACWENPTDLEMAYFEAESMWKRFEDGSK